MRLSDIGEFGLIENIRKRHPVKDKSVIIGIGDDAAAVRVKGINHILLTTDTLVEKVHFDLKYFRYFEVGWKLMAANLSDIAAMGGTPKYALVTLGLNDRMRAKDVDELYKGINSLASQYKVAIVGGDIVRSPKSLFFTMHLIGVADKVVKRSGARAGDKIVVIGKFGASAVGLVGLKRFGRQSADISPHLMPVPMIKEGRLAAKYATSMIDNSDGLARCLIEICKAGRVGAKIYTDMVPLAKGASLEAALNGGEDYNLVMTVPKKKAVRIKGGKVIGEITKGGSIVLIDKAGSKQILIQKGYEQI